MQHKTVNDKQSTHKSKIVQFSPKIKAKKFFLVTFYRFSVSQNVFQIHIKVGIIDRIKVMQKTLIRCLFESCKSREGDEWRARSKNCIFIFQPKHLVIPLCTLKRKLLLSSHTHHDVSLKTPNKKTECAVGSRRGRRWREGGNLVNWTWTCLPRLLGLREGNQMFTQNYALNWNKNVRKMLFFQKEDKNLRK